MSANCTCHFQSPEVCEVHKHELSQPEVLKRLLAYHMENDELAQLIDRLIQAHVEALVKKLKSELNTVFFPETQR